MAEVLKKVLVLGRQGQLAQALQATLPKDITAIFLGRQQIDINDRYQLEKVISTHGCTAVINAAGYTAVDRAEGDKRAAYKLNYLAVARLAMVCRRLGCRLIHLSSDYVFDGRQQTAYAVTAKTNPLNTYGLSKRAGEKVLAQLYPNNSTVIRSSWLYSQYGDNFVKTIVSAMQHSDTIQVVDDQYGSPTYAVSLANFIWRLVDRAKLAAIYHWSDVGTTSWFRFAEAIKMLAQEQGLIGNNITINRISTKNSPFVAKRPSFSSLCTRESQAILSANDWQDNLRLVISKL